MKNLCRLHYDVNSACETCLRRPSLQFVRRECGELTVSHSDGEAEGSYRDLQSRGTKVPVPSGVVSDVKNSDLGRSPLPAAYLPYTIISSGGESILVRTVVDLDSLISAIRHEV